MGRQRKRTLDVQQLRGKTMEFTGTVGQQSGDVQRNGKACSRSRCVWESEEKAAPLRGAIWCSLDFVSRERTERMQSHRTGGDDTGRKNSEDRAQDNAPGLYDKASVEEDGLIRHLMRRYKRDGRKQESIVTKAKRKGPKEGKRKLTKKRATGNP